LISTPNNGERAYKREARLDSAGKVRAWDVPVIDFFSGDEMTRVTIQNRDEILGVVVRALVIAIAGFQAVGGMNPNYFRAHGFYRFPLEPHQADRLKELVRNYVPERFQSLIQIADE
jgi:hypothetical protein